jgi:transcriptional regulator with PAS, ATPase and Fis domain
MPEPLFESELFGYERGAFTGAVKQKPGLLEFANGGTFLLDEIADMPIPMQAKLLRIIEDRKIRRIGGQKEIDIDIRILSATNKNLQEAVANGDFREDLFYRINTVQIVVPPLRERREDIIPLSNLFLHDLCKHNSDFCKELSPEAEEMLINYDWPGNVRELHNIIGRAFYLANSHLLLPEDIPLPTKNRSVCFNLNIINLNYKEAKKQLMEKFEIEYLTHHLKKNMGNISKTAEECGLDRRTIHRLINEYNIFYENK